MSWTLCSLAHAQHQAWKNGGGLTRELLAWPKADDWQLRISIADVTQDGAFSSFAGVQRWFAVLGGAGVALNARGAATELRGDSPAFEFDGAAATDCRLINGPTQDINLMLRGLSGRMARVRGESLTAKLTTNKLIATYSMNAVTNIEFDAEIMVLEPQTLAWRIASSCGAVKVTSANAIWMEIEL